MLLEKAHTSPPQPHLSLVTRPENPMRSLTFYLLTLDQWRGLVGPNSISNLLL